MFGVLPLASCQDRTRHMQVHTLGWLQFPRPMLAPLIFSVISDPQGSSSNCRIFMGSTVFRFCVPETTHHQATSENTGPHQQSFNVDHVQRQLSHLRAANIRACDSHTPSTQADKCSSQERCSFHRSHNGSNRTRHRLHQCTWDRTNPGCIWPRNNRRLGSPLQPV